MRLCVAVGERALEARARLLVARGRALAQRVELTAQRAEINRRIRGHPGDYHALKVPVHGPLGLSWARLRPMNLDPLLTGLNNGSVRRALAVLLACATALAFAAYGATGSGSPKPLSVRLAPGVGAAHFAVAPSARCPLPPSRARPGLWPS